MNHKEGVEFSVMGSDVLAGNDFISPSKTDDSSIFASPMAVTAALTASGVAGRAGLQHVPSVEPLIAVAVASGFYFGAKEGILAGTTGYYLSNFLVFGGQGPWTIFQVVGAGLSGLTGALFGKFLDGRTAFFSSILIGVASFELMVNLGSLTFAFSTGGLAYLISAVPFILTHFASTVGFGLILYGSKEKIGLYRKN